MSWSNAFLGLPHRDLGRDRAGADCWGLAVLVYRELLGVTLPDYLGYGSTSEHAEIAAIVAGATASPLWSHVTDPQPFDIAVFRRGRWSSHVGIVVEAGAMLHVAAGSHSRIEDYRVGAWRHRLTGFYRHVETSFNDALRAA